MKTPSWQALDPSTIQSSDLQAVQQQHCTSSHNAASTSTFSEVLSSVISYISLTLKSRVYNQSKNITGYNWDTLLIQSCLCTIQWLPYASLISTVQHIVCMNYLIYAGENTSAWCPHTASLSSCRPAQTHWGATLDTDFTSLSVSDPMLCSPPSVAPSVRSVGSLSHAYWRLINSN